MSDVNLGVGGVSTKPPRPDKEKAVASKEMGKKTNLPGPGESVADLMARLHLTAVEAKAVVLDDEDEADPVDPDLAFVGKVVAPNTLHIQTIAAAMRLAWGNPRGLLFNSVGDNLFLTEFGSKSDIEFWMAHHGSLGSTRY